jgi:SpoIIAA-like
LRWQGGGGASVEEAILVIEEIGDLPTGVIGFRISGKITRDDYEAILPRIEQGADAGDVRFLCVIGPDWEGMTGGALWEDVRTGLKYEVFHRANWKRTAVVTDLDWIRRTMDLLGWIAPGELKLFSHDQLADAKAWVAG